MDDLEKLLLADEEEKAPAPASEPVKVQEPEVDPEVQKKEEIKANLDRAIAEMNGRLKKLRKEEKSIKSGEPEEEDLPRIDMDDPSAKAWDKHIRQQVSPVKYELEQEKAEVREAAIRDFLSDKPSLASKPEKVKELVSEYEALSKGRISERTKEGVITYLGKAYASIFHEELLNAARGRRIDQAKADVLFSDIAVSKGATSYASKEDASQEKLSEDDRRVLAKWGMSPQEWQDQRKKYK